MKSVRRKFYWENFIEIATGSEIGYVRIFRTGPGYPRPEQFSNLVPQALSSLGAPEFACATVKKEREGKNKEK